VTFPLVASSNLALGTTTSFWNKPETHLLTFSEEFETIQVADVFKSSFHQALDSLRRLSQFEDEIILFFICLNQLGVEQRVFDVLVS
jgi:hypothetical protein